MGNWEEFIDGDDDHADDFWHDVVHGDDALEMTYDEATAEYWGGPGPLDRLPEDYSVPGWKKSRDMFADMVRDLRRGDDYEMTRYRR